MLARRGSPSSSCGPPGARYGKLLVAPIEAARGLAFDVVFVPGLAERMFPQKVVEDPLLLDDARARRSALDRARRSRWPTSGSRCGSRSAPRRDARRAVVSAHRSRAGAAARAVVLRARGARGRPRARCPASTSSAGAPNVTGAARIGWPAPADRIDAIDEAEHDLALLDEPRRARAPRRRRWAPRTTCSARTRTSRARCGSARGAGTCRRWKPRRRPDRRRPPEGTRRARRARARRALVLADRARAVRGVPVPVRAAHDRAARAARGARADRGARPARARLARPRGPVRAARRAARSAACCRCADATLDAARDRLDAVLERVAARYRDELVPGDRARVGRRHRVDPRRSARVAAPHGRRRRVDAERASSSRSASTGQRRPRPGERRRAGRRSIGLTLRGSIDLVERARDGRVRATDYKTGKAKVEPGSMIGGGKSLQPVLYALVLEKLFPGRAGRRRPALLLHDARRLPATSTSRSTTTARAAAHAARRRRSRDHFERGFFPAAPAQGRVHVLRLPRGLRAVRGAARARKKQTEPLAAARSS